MNMDMRDERDMFDMMSCFFSFMTGVWQWGGVFGEGSPFWGLMVDASAGTRRGLFFSSFPSAFFLFPCPSFRPPSWGTLLISLSISLLGLSFYSILEP